MADAEPEPVKYQIILRPSARRGLTSIPEKVAAACFEFIMGPLADNPHRAGKPLREPLAPRYSARRGEYRVLYLINDGRVVVDVIQVSHRRDAYRP